MSVNARPGQLVQLLTSSAFEKGAREIVGKVAPLTPALSGSGNHRMGLCVTDRETGEVFFHPDLRVEHAKDGGGSEGNFLFKFDRKTWMIEQYPADLPPEKMFMRVPLARYEPLRVEMISLELMLDLDRTVRSAEICFRARSSKPTCRWSGKHPLTLYRSVLIRRPNPSGDSRLYDVVCVGCLDHGNVPSDAEVLLDGRRIARNSPVMQMDRPYHYEGD